MQVPAKAGELITDLLLKKVGSDSDEVEAEFYRLNPHIRVDIFPHDCVVTLPQNVTSSRKQSVTRSWD
ncbi:hypothetical protein ABF162_08220 [Vibrio coralliilyticus]|uniref:hypothetical protein n=1 Tax=Vibrio coralliilyticus TaxID=190893 RepID=UPI0005127755|nr:hypothetical protein [Vibrio coralliilyticus]AIU66988.1 hypothetical protein JV59_32200 [Vibrio coralliilyticus]